MVGGEESRLTQEDSRVHDELEDEFGGRGTLRSNNNNDNNNNNPSYGLTD
jgi:hypothetical protein